MADNIDQASKATVEKFRRAYEKDEAKEEALKAKMERGIASVLKKRGQDVAKDFLEYGREGDWKRDLERIKNTGSGYSPSYDQETANIEPDEDYED
jgi:hypothetical protein